MEAGTGAHRPSHRRWLAGATDVALAAGVLVLGLLVATVVPFESPRGAVVLGVVVVAVALRRRALVVSAALVAAAGVAQVAWGEPLSGAQVGMLVVVYTASAHGSRTLVWVSGLLLPVVAVVATGHQLVTGPVLVVVPPAAGASWWTELAALGALSLVVPLVAWLLGLLRRVALRAREEAWRAGVARVEADRAEQVAALQHQRADLAREVHDVVGHSLAVVIAQADSVRFRDPADPASPVLVQEAVAAIAATARRSSGEVRSALARLAPAPEDEWSGAPPQERLGAPAGPEEEVESEGLQDLVARVETAGVTVVRQDEGEPQDLDAGTRGVLVAVVREMLTNALRHGDLERPVVLRQCWRPGELVVEVRNRVRPAGGLEHLGASADSGGPDSGGPGSGAGETAAGRGTAGMQHRLSRVGGGLTVGAADGAEASAGRGVFVAAARVPVPDQVPAVGADPATPAAVPAARQVRAP